MAKLSLQIVQGAIATILGTGVTETIDAYGIPDADYNLTTGKRPWLGTDRPKVFRTIEALMYGTLDIMGIPRFEVPAEYCAAIISTFVTPTNYMAACAWVGQQPTTEDLTQFTAENSVLEGIERCTPSQLFALCIDIASDSTSEKLCAAFEAKTKRALGRLECCKVEEK